MALYGEHGRIYPVGSGIGQPLHKYIEELRDMIDPSLPLGFGEIPYASGQVMHLEANIAVLKEETGFEPKITFEEGVRKTIEHIRSFDELTIFNK